MPGFIFRLKSLEVVFAALIFGCLATFSELYMYGDAGANFIEYLPVIQRLNDSSLYPVDFYVKEAVGFSVRTYTLQTLAWLSQALPLYLVVLIAVLLGNSLIMGVVFLIGRDLFRDDRYILTGMAFLGALKGISLGWATFAIWHEFNQATYSEVFALLALWQGLRNRSLPAILFSMAAVAIHPVMGFLSGGAILSMMTLNRLWLAWVHRSDGALVNSAGRVLAPVGGMALLMAVLYGLYMGRFASEPTNDLFFYITFYLRASHHYVPSHFMMRDWVLLPFFLLGFGLAFLDWRRREGNHHPMLLPLFLLMLVVFAGLVVGYAGVEILPIQSIASAQLYRLLYLVNLLGLIFAGRSAAAWLFTAESKPQRISAGLLFLGNYNIQPIAYSFSHLGEYAGRWLGRKYGKPGEWGPRIAAGLVIVAGWVVISVRIRETIFLAILFGLVLLINALAAKSWRMVVPTLLAAMIFTSLVAFRTSLPFDQHIANIRIEDGDYPLDDVALWARENTPVDALFITPSKSARFRLVAQRSIVVDFKCFPFQASAALDWYQRLVDIHGEPDGLGFTAMNNWDERYHDITDDKLRELGSQFNAGYAVLFKDTDTALPVLVEGNEFKIVRIEEPSQEP